MRAVESTLQVRRRNLRGRVFDTRESSVRADVEPITERIIDAFRVHGRSHDQRRPTAMSHALRTLTALAALLVITGCATGPTITTHTMPQADFAAYETFGFPDEVGTDRGGYESRITQYFKAASRSEMEGLGYRYADNDPDLLVNFFANAEEKQEVYTRMSPTFSAGYYGYRYGMYTAWPMYTTEVDTFDYTVGTANIDVVDAEENRLIWEGRAEGRLTRSVMSDPESAIYDTVAEIFARFPARNPGN